MKKQALLIAHAVAIVALLVSATAVMAQDEGEGQQPETLYAARIMPLNDSSVGALALIQMGDNGMRVSLVAIGLETGQTHPQHIHGDGQSDATCPTPEAAGEDNVLTFEEGSPAYGAVAQPLEPFPMVEEEGPVQYSEAFQQTDITDPSQHVIVLHGMTMEGTYEQGLPVACGEIVPFDQVGQSMATQGNG